MPIRNTDASYGIITRTLHILLGVTVLVIISIGIVMGSLPAGSALQKQAYNIHKILGLLALFEVIIFIAWTICNAKPRYPDSMNTLERGTARIVRVLLYLLVLTMAISGWTLATGAARPPMLFGIPLPLPFGIKPSPSVTGFAADVHVTTAWIIGSVIALHFLGAMKHHLVNKDFVLRRMFTGKSQ